MLFRTVCAAAALGLAACASPPEPPGRADLAEVGRDRLVRQQAIDHPDRPADDRKDDAARKARAVMDFSGVAQGMTVVELEAGGGYYTELFSRVVGPAGKVYMQNPAGFDAFLGDSVDQRLADDRLPNVEVMRTDFDALDAPAASADLVTWILGPHELWFFPNNGPGFGDPKASFAEIARVLKPGGVLVLLDHRAPAGAPPTTGGDTHRIDPAVVTALAEAAGLALSAESDILANPDDDLTVNVFAPSVRRQTDRFLLKYRKPA